jgi:hypothetical protein
MSENGETMPKIVRLLDAARDGIVPPLSRNKIREAAARGEIPGCFQLRAGGVWFLDLTKWRAAMTDLQPSRVAPLPARSQADAQRAAARALDLARALRRRRAK